MNDSSPQDPGHVPVLVERVLALVAPALDRTDGSDTPDTPDGSDSPVFVDATLGLGGHTEAVLRRCPQARVVGLDRDRHALDRSRRRLAAYGERVSFVHAVYDEIPRVLAELGHPHVDGVLFDLGVSSMQLDVRERGFAYAEDAPLDMRMDDTAGRTAADVLNTYPAAELARILRSYGEERYARRIADAVVRARVREPFTGSARLVDLVRQAIPAPARRTGGHPAKRTFQALRIEVNDELDVLRRALPAAIEAIGIGGRVVVLSYHSLEDRITKQTFTDYTASVAPPDLPVVPEGLEPALRLLTRGAEHASAEEVSANPRAASVRMRAVERVRLDTARRQTRHTRRTRGGGSHR
ncbi:MAG TPA: 16S rRNA (cytosine(1402)-N(4))-methyltransferase RsmH [Nocardioidaceae bacterium]|nr:16S rRNA (cytosine(1402)-N(4))-methyltransferase RsmH [Nocardioidaceae bacterium]